MAVWHFKFGLVPAAAIKRLRGSNVSHLTEFETSVDRPPNLVDLDEQTNFWADRNTAELIPGASDLLPEMESWSDDATMFGRDGSDRIEIWQDDVSCRLDLRDFSAPLASGLLKLARTFGCKIVLEGTGEIISPDENVFLDRLRASRAAQFCNDPRGYLADLSKPPPTDE